MGEERGRGEEERRGREEERRGREEESGKWWRRRR